MEAKKFGMKTMMDSISKDMANEDIDSSLKIKLTVLAGLIYKFVYITPTVIAIDLMAHKIILASRFKPYFQIGLIPAIQDA